MTRGKAQGQNKEYQVLCRDVLMREHQDLAAFRGDGIDIPLDVGDTVWTFDVALRAPDDRLVLAECRRRKQAVKQEDVAAFAYRVEQVRKHIHPAVAAVFLTKSDFQAGALRVAASAGVSAIICAQGQQLENFRLRYLRHDPDRQRRVERMVYHYTGGRGKLTLEGRRWLKQMLSGATRRTVRGEPTKSGRPHS